MTKRWIEKKALVEWELNIAQMCPTLGPEPTRERLITMNNTINQVFGDVFLFPVFSGRVGQGGDVESG